MNKHNPIGIFDSGLGGLSILHALKTTLPNENIVYFADLGFSPYGIKSSDEIKQRCDYITRFLIDQGCKLIVVACNTATVNTIAMLRSKYSIPIIGVEPGIKPASLASQSRSIGVMATELTLNSDSFKQLTDTHGKNVKIHSQACPDFVHLVENLDHEGETAFATAQRYVQPLLSSGCDQIVLGCTHFSFLKPVISKIAGESVSIIDTAQPVAQQVKRKLEYFQIGNDDHEQGSAAFWTSGCIEKTQATVAKLWGASKVSKVAP